MGSGGGVSYAVKALDAVGGRQLLLPSEYLGDYSRALALHVAAERRSRFEDPIGGIYRNQDTDAYISSCQCIYIFSH